MRTLSLPRMLMDHLVMNLKSGTLVLLSEQIVLLQHFQFLEFFVELVLLFVAAGVL